MSDTILRASGPQATGPLGSGFTGTDGVQYFHGAVYNTGPPQRNGEGVAVRIDRLSLPYRQGLPASVLYPAVLRRVYWGQLGGARSRWLYIAGVRWLTFREDFGPATVGKTGMRANAAAAANQFSEVPLECLEGAVRTIHSRTCTLKISELLIEIVAPYSLQCAQGSH